MKTSVGRNIARLRLARGMTQERLAARMGVSPQAVSKWENDLNYPDVATLPLLAATLGTSIDALLAVDRTAEPAAGPATTAEEPEPAEAANAPAAEEPAPTGAAGAIGSLIVVDDHARAGGADESQAGTGPVGPDRQGAGGGADSARLRIRVEGPRNNVNLAIPLNLLKALGGFAATVPQVRAALLAHGLDPSAVLSTALNATDAVGPATLLDVTDGEDRVHLYIE